MPEPVRLQEALAGFEALWSPRIVTRVNDYDVRIAKVRGDHVWHVHDTTDEFFLVLDGELTISLREDTGRTAGHGSGQEGREGDGDRDRALRDPGTRSERVVRLTRGSVFVVGKGIEHRPSSPEGASILMFEPSGTVSVGDRHEEIPEHVDATTGHALTHS
ncbi:cupin domain-containing protein [Streptomyces sp. NBC_01497]|nr:cupin domain-containing protein [Streptomyces sp. NBC_01497]